MRRTNLRTWRRDLAVVAHRSGGIASSSDGIDTVFTSRCPRAASTMLRPARRVGRAAGGLKEGSAKLCEAVAASDVARMIITSSVAVYGKPWGEVEENRADRSGLRLRAGTGSRRKDCAAISFRASRQRLSIARLTEPSVPGAGDKPAAQQDCRRTLSDDRGRSRHPPSQHVEDTAAGLIALARSGSAGGSVLHIGSRARSLLDFVAAASRHSAGRSGSRPGPAPRRRRC